MSCESWLNSYKARGFPAISVASAYRPRRPVSSCHNLLKIFRVTSAQRLNSLACTVGIRGDAGSPRKRYEVARPLIVVPCMC